MVNESLKAAKEAGAEIRCIRLVEKEIRACDGCDICIKNRKCHIQDDMAEVLEEMVLSDGIIIASPVYIGGVTSQVKALIDRVGHFNVKALNRTALTGKVGGAIVAGDSAGFFLTLAQILHFFLIVRMIIAGAPQVYGRGYARGDVLKDIEGLKRARELGNAMVDLAKKLKSS